MPASQAGRRGFDPRLPLHLSTCRIKFALIRALTLRGRFCPLSSPAHVPGCVTWPEFARKVGPRPYGLDRTVCIALSIGKHLGLETYFAPARDLATISFTSASSAGA